MSRYFENCIDCENRKPGCHSYCELYIEDKKLQMADNARNRKKHNAEFEAIDYANTKATRLRNRYKK